MDSISSDQTTSKMIYCENLETFSIPIPSPSGLGDNFLSFCHLGRKKHGLSLLGDMFISDPLIDLLSPKMEIENSSDRDEAYQIPEIETKLGRNHVIFLLGQADGAPGSRYKIYLRNNGRKYLDFYLFKFTNSGFSGKKSVKVRKLEMRDYCQYRLRSSFYIFYHEETDELFLFHKNVLEIYDGTSLERKKRSEVTEGYDVFSSVARDNRGCYLCSVACCDDEFTANLVGRRGKVTSIQRWSPDMKKLEETIPRETFCQAPEEDCQASNEPLFFHQAGVFLYIYSTINEDTYMSVFAPDFSLLAKIRLLSEREGRRLYYTFMIKDDKIIFYVDNFWKGGPWMHETGVWFEIEIRPAIAQKDTVSREVIPLKPPVYHVDHYTLPLEQSVSWGTVLKNIFRAVCSYFCFGRA